MYWGCFYLYRKSTARHNQHYLGCACWLHRKGAAPADFHEVWHLVKPHDGSREWAIAGITPLQA